MCSLNLKIHFLAEEFPTLLKAACNLWSKNGILLLLSVAQLEDCDYKPLDPKDIRLPPPMPPSDRLLAAVEAFYSPPSHDRPRNRFIHFDKYKEL